MRRRVNRHRRARGAGGVLDDGDHEPGRTSSDRNCHRCNEAPRIGRVVERLQAVPDVDAAVVDDGSTDHTALVVRTAGGVLIARAVQGGAGAAIRVAYQWARRQGYDVCVILAGNDKDRPSEIGRLVAPIIRGDADLVQGSRYLPGGVSVNVPFSRRVATKWIHPILFSLKAGQRMTDTTNGFRAIRLSILEDPRFAIDQPWLDGYQLEPYVLLKAIALGYRVVEVPVTKVYPRPGESYTKMRAVTGWWEIVKPIVLAPVRRR